MVFLGKALPASSGNNNKVGCQEDGRRRTTAECCVRTEQAFLDLMFQEADVVLDAAADGSVLIAVIAVGSGSCCADYD